MGLLKKGDKVKVICSKGALEQGEVCTIAFVDENDPQLPYKLKNAGGFTCWAPEDCFIPIPKFHVGQVYHIEKSINDEDWDGSIFKISGIKHAPGACLLTTKPIRGSNPKSFFKDSSLSKSITLLTGKEIGEAIRKWDADHAKKPELKYNEVKRHAKVGEKIKTITIDGSGAALGKTYEVLEVDDDGWVRVSERGTLTWLRDTQYVVLVPKVKEVKRVAKVGEYIKLIRSNEDYSAGKVFKVIADGADGDIYVSTKKNSEFTGDAADRHIEQPFLFVASYDYVVLEGYKPEQKSKHSYTDEQVAEAKRIVIDTIRELAKCPKYVFFTSADDKEIAYMTTEDTCALGATGGTDQTLTALKVGVSKCSNHDEPNEWVGKCVALCKVLHKPIPKFIMDGD